jgi:hypothetical protein
MDIVTIDTCDVCSQRFCVGSPRHWSTEACTPGVQEHTQPRPRTLARVRVRGRRGGKARSRLVPLGWSTEACSPSPCTRTRLRARGIKGRWGGENGMQAHTQPRPRTLARVREGGPWGGNQARGFEVRGCVGAQASSLAGSATALSRFRDSTELRHCCVELAGRSGPFCQRERTRPRVRGVDGGASWAPPSLFRVGLVVGGEVDSAE